MLWRGLSYITRVYIASWQLVAPCDAAMSVRARWWCSRDLARRPGHVEQPHKQRTSWRLVPAGRRCDDSEESLSATCCREPLQIWDIPA